MQPPTVWLFNPPHTIQVHTCKTGMSLHVASGTLTYRLQALHLYAGTENPAEHNLRQLLAQPHHTRLSCHSHQQHASSIASYCTRGTKCNSSISVSTALLPSTPPLTLPCCMLYIQATSAPPPCWTCHYHTHSSCCTVAQQAHISRSNKGAI